MRCLFSCERSFVFATELFGKTKALHACAFVSLIHFWATHSQENITPGVKTMKEQSKSNK